MRYDATRRAPATGSDAIDWDLLSIQIISYTFVIAKIGKTYIKTNKVLYIWFYIMGGLLCFILTCCWADAAEVLRDHWHLKGTSTLLPWLSIYGKWRSLEFLGFITEGLYLFLMEVTVMLALRGKGTVKSITTQILRLWEGGWYLLSQKIGFCSGTCMNSQYIWTFCYCLYTRFWLH